MFIGYKVFLRLTYISLKHAIFNLRIFIFTEKTAILLVKYRMCFTLGHTLSMYYLCQLSFIYYNLFKSNNAQFYYDFPGIKENF